MSGSSPDRSRVLTIPNLISFSRIVLVGVFWWLVVGDYPTGAALLLILMATTDWLDGWLARRLDQVTDLGAILDPVGDALMMASAVLGGTIKTWVPIWIGMFILFRFALMSAWSVWVFFRTKNPIEVRMSGKVAITLLYIAIPIFYFASDVADSLQIWLGVLAWATAVVGLVFYWWSAGWYFRDGLDLLSRRGGSATG